MSTRSVPSNGQARPGPNLYAIVLFDVVGSGTVNGEGQRRLRRDLDDLVRGALSRTRLRPTSLPITDTGDGLRVLIPLDRVQPVEVVDTVVLGMAAGLRRHRRYAAEGARMRVKVAFDLGVVEPHLRGWTGDVLVRVARLIAARPLREALRQDERLDFAAVVSDPMYETVIRPDDGYLAPECFRSIRVSVKEFHAQAWLLTPTVSWLTGSRDGAAA